MRREAFSVWSSIMHSHEKIARYEALRKGRKHRDQLGAIASERDSVRGWLRLCTLTMHPSTCLQHVPDVVSIGVITQSASTLD